MRKGTINLTDCVTIKYKKGATFFGFILINDYMTCLFKTKSDSIRMNYFEIQGMHQSSLNCYLRLHIQYYQTRHLKQYRTGGRKSFFM